MSAETSPLPYHAQKTHQRRHELHHHLNDISAEPFLTIPFNTQDFQQSPLPEEGWIYSTDERHFHGKWRHLGLDYKAPYGTAVLAPCDGLAVSSYFTYTVRYKHGNAPKLIEGKPVGMGLGYFVQIRADNGQYVHLGHLSEITDIPFSQPQFDEGDWYPTNHNISPDELDQKFVTRVQKGQLVGRVGHSGLTWGGPPEYVQGLTKPMLLDPDIPSWDDTHLHWAVSEMVGKTKYFRDILDVYLWAKYYQNFTGPEPLIFMDDAGNPIFAA